MGVLSTTCSGGSGSKYNLYLEYTLVSQDIANNRSLIRLHMYAQSSSSTYGAYNLNSTANSYAIKINGSNVKSGTMAMDFRNRAVVDFGTYEGYVSHNSDGTLSITIGGSFSISGASSLTGGSISGTWALTTIPRASAITTFANFTIGDNIPVTLDIKASFTHTLTLKVGSTTVATRTGITASSYTLTLSSAEQDVIYNAIPNATSVNVNLYCETFSGSTKIGATQSKSAIASIGASIVPSFTSLTAVETVSAVNTAVGKFVQNLSKIKFDINGAVGVKSSTITGYTIIFNGVTYSGSTATTGVINKSGDIVATATITDSRGRTASKTLTINLLPYAVPQITAFSLSRCNADGTANPLGTYVKVISTGSVTSLLNGTEKNNLTYKIYSKDRGAVTWTEKKSLVVVGLSINATDILGTYDAISSFDFRLDIIDKFNTTISLSVLPTGKVTMSWGQEGIGVGKVWEQGALDVQGDAFISGTVYEGGTVLSSKYAPIHSHPYVPTSTYTAGDILTKLKTVDGANSGLDADMVDGYHSGSFLITTGGDTTSSWTKFPDGTLITKQLVSLGTVAITSAWGSMYTSGSKAMPDYPVVFIDTPAVFINISNTANNSVWVGTCGVGTASTPPKVELFRATTASPTWVYIHIVAIGRWK